MPYFRMCKNTGNKGNLVNFCEISQITQLHLCNSSPRKPQKTCRLQHPVGDNKPIYIFLYLYTLSDKKAQDMTEEQ